MIGIGRLVDRIEPIRPLAIGRKYAFTQESVYGAIAAGSQQVQHITGYEFHSSIPVYYNLYNPPDLPYHSTVPRLALEKVDVFPTLGCRVLRAADVHAALNALPIGKSPRFFELLSRHANSSNDLHGWRLESFVADEVLRCREGRLFEDARDARLASLVYERTAPIAAAIVVTIDLASDYR
jgi:hypothetical protein